MSIFRCEKCGCVENTALCWYWSSIGKDKQKLCSECDPEIGHWHGRFPKMSSEGYLLGSDGFLYTEEENNSGALDWRKKNQGFFIVRKIESNKCSKCGGTGVFQYYYDAGDHFSAGPSPNSGFRSEPCDKCKN